VRIRRFLLALASAAAAAALAVPAASAGGANNLVLVQATTDGQVVQRAQLQVAPFGGDDVGSTNLAAATSQACTGCGTVAIALQAVFVTGEPGSVAPANAAVATNAGCTSCSSYAFAYQYVVETHGPVYLSPDGRVELGVLRQELDDAAASGLPDDELTARLDELAGELKAIVDEELVRAGESPNGTATTHVETSS